MHLTIQLGIYGLAVLILYKIITGWVQNRQHAAQAKALGCLPAPVLPDCGFLGLKNLREMLDATNNQWLPDLFLSRQQKLSAIHGRQVSTYRNFVLGQDLIMTSDPLNIQTVLAAKFGDFDVGMVRKGVLMPTFGNGVFVQDGKEWEHSRSMLRPQFVRDQVSDLDLEEEHVQNLLRVMPVQADGWTAMTDIQALFHRLTIDSACEFLFGESPGSQLSASGLGPAEAKYRVNFNQHYDNALIHLARRFRYSDFYWLHNPKDFRNDNKVIHDFVQPLVERAMKRAADKKEKQSDHGGKQSYVFLEALAEHSDDADMLRDQCLNLLLAGRDTTASLLSWLFFELLSNPEAFKKLRTTIVDMFGTYHNPHNITFATLKDCRYLQWCLNETMRLWPMVPANGRRSNKITTLPRGGGPDGQSPIYLRPESEVNYSVHVMHRRKDLWGEDAGEFKPERWNGRKVGWDFLPFNGGPRICIGQQFALTEAGYVVVRLLQKFDMIETTPDLFELPIPSNMTLTSCPGRPTTLRLHEAQDAKSS